MGGLVDRWKLLSQKNPDGSVDMKAVPEIDALTKFIGEQANAMAEKLARAEDEMILRALPVETLEHFVKICQDELADRKNK